MNQPPQWTQCRGISFSACVIITISFLLLVGGATCLAVSHSSVPNPNNKVIGVISTKTDSGATKAFSFEMPSEGGSKNLSKRNHKAKSLGNRLVAGVRSTFLPSGFPNRTPHGYLTFSVWSWIQDISTQLRSVLATQRVLEGVGVGREGATALSALMNFLVRDGCGMAASLLFTSVASSRFKSDVKRWRLFADIMVDIGITLEVAATIVPTALFLPMISLGNMCKAICGVASGACGGAINLHWATGSDISDINAKFGAQHTVTGSLGLVFAALFARSIATVQEVNVWIIYSALTALHVFANMQCMRQVAFESLNTARMNIVAAEFFKWWKEHQSLETTALENGKVSYTGPRIPLSTPQEVSKKEPLIFVSRRPRNLEPFPIYFGVSFNDFSKRSTKTLPELEEMILTSSDGNYLISAGPCMRRGKCVVVSLSTNITPEDEARAYFHALLLDKELAKPHQSLQEAEKAAAAKLDLEWSAFATSLQLSGWDLTKTVLRTAGYEISLQL